MTNSSNFKTLTTVELLNFKVFDTIKVAVYDDKNNFRSTFDLEVIETDKSDKQFPICVGVPVSLIESDELLREITKFSGLSEQDGLKSYWLDEPTIAGNRLVAVKEAEENPQTFKAGDFVYFPQFSTDVCLVVEAGVGEFRLHAKCLKTGKTSAYFQTNGRLYSSHQFASVFLATEENRKKLSDLYGAEFDVVSKLEILKEKLKQTNLVLISLDDGEKPQHLEDLDGTFCVVRKVKSIKGNRIYTENHGFYDEDDYEYVDAICVDAEGCIVYL